MPDRSEIVLALFLAKWFCVFLQPRALKVMSGLIRRSACDITPDNILGTSMLAADGATILRDTARARQIAAYKRFVGRHRRDDSIWCVYEKNGSFSNRTRGSK